MPDPAAITQPPRRRALAAADAAADTVVLDAPVPAVVASITAQAMNALAYIHTEVILATEDGREHLIDAAWRKYSTQAHLPPDKRTPEGGPASVNGRIVLGALRRLRCADDTVLVPVPAPVPMRVLGTARLPDFAAPPTGRDLAALTDPSGIAAAYRRHLGPPD